MATPAEQLIQNANSNPGKAMQQIGFPNGLLATSVGQPEPQVGMGITEFYGSDRRPGTVIWVSPDLKKIHVARDSWKNTGSYEDPTYDITPADGSNGHSEYLRGKDGRYRQGTRSLKERAIMVGSRDCYTDPSF